MGKEEGEGNHNKNPVFDTYCENTYLFDTY